MEKQKVVSLMSQPTIKAATYQDILTKKIESPRGYTPENMEKLVMVLKKNESLI